MEKLANEIVVRCEAALEELESKRKTDWDKLGSLAKELEELIQAYKASMNKHETK